MTTPPESEPTAVAARYARRDIGDRYSVLRPEVWQSRQERQRVLIDLLSRHAPAPLDRLDALEIGCGTGGNLIELAGLGFDAARLVGNELLPERARLARRQLPALTALHEGDALTLPFEPGSFDVVYQSTVFTSLLDARFREQLAQRMWLWVRPGGGVLWYDFTVDNPRNPDVSGVPQAELQALFPQGRIEARRVTLAPPISRRVVKFHPSMYTAFNALPFLRTHLLCWIGKPR